MERVKTYRTQQSYIYNNNNKFNTVANIREQVVIKSQVNVIYKV